MAGNNIPFMPGAAKAPQQVGPAHGERGDLTPMQKFPKHRVPNDMRTERLVTNYPNGKAYSGRQSNEMAVIQRAAGKRLFDLKGGSFAANYPRNTNG